MKNSHFVAIAGSGTLAGATLLAVLAVPAPVKANEYFYAQTGVSCSSCHQDGANPTKERLTWVGSNFQSCKRNGQANCNQLAKSDEARFKSGQFASAPGGYQGPANQTYANPNPGPNPGPNTGARGNPYPPTAGGGYQGPANQGYPNQSTAGGGYQGPANQGYPPPGPGAQPLPPPKQSSATSAGQFLGALLGGLLSGSSSNTSRPAGGYAGPAYQPPATGFDPGVSWRVVERMGRGRVIDSLWQRQGGTNLYSAIFVDSATGAQVNDTVEYTGLNNGQITFRRRGTGTLYNGVLHADGIHVISGSLSPVNTRYPADFTWSAARSSR